MAGDESSQGAIVFRVLRALCNLVNRAGAGGGGCRPMSTIIASGHIHKRSSGAEASE
jgi:hypothetical protein